MRRASQHILSKLFIGKVGSFYGQCCSSLISDQQIGATVLSTIGTIALIIVIREYFLTKALLTPSLTPLFGQLIADILWLITYTPYIWTTAIQGYLPTGAWCQVVCYFVAMSYLLSAVSGIVASALGMIVLCDSIGR
jgi:uncharacterized membrane protein YeaQ/YmgE (transglycosylase-associated protein family)